MISISTADKVLKDYYLDVVSEQMNTSTSPFLAMVEKTSDYVFGKDVKKVVTHDLNGGVVAGSETGEVPVFPGNSYAEFTLPLKNLYGSIEISDKALRASENNSGAVVNLLNAEMEGLLKASKNNVARMLFGTGDTMLCTVSDNTADGVIVTDANPFYIGMYVEVHNPIGEVVSEIGVAKVVSVDKENNIVVFDKDSTLFSGSQTIHVYGASDSELTGLKAIFSNTGTLYGLSKAQNPWLIPYTKTVSGTLTISDIQKTLDTIEERSGEQADVIICSWAVRRVLQKLFAENKIATEPMVLDGGYKAISYNGIPIIVDRFCPNDTMYLLNSKDFKLHQLCDWQWLESEDGKILHKIPGKAAYSATLVKYADLLCERPCGQAKISGITEN